MFACFRCPPRHLFWAVRGVMAKLPLIASRHARDLTAAQNPIDEGINPNNSKIMAASVTGSDKSSGYFPQKQLGHTHYSHHMGFKTKLYLIKNKKNSHFLNNAYYFERF